MKIHRREFIKSVSIATALLSTGGIQYLSNSELFGFRRKVKFRFILASDAHYGEKDTPYAKMMDTFIEKANVFHELQKVDFCVVNGDIIHDDPKFLTPSKQHLEKLDMPYYVTKGNHDKVSDQEWKRVFGMDVNHAFSIYKNGCILATTSDEAGQYLSPNLTWLKARLEEFSTRKNVFIFIHIPQLKRTENAIDNPAFYELLRNYPNVRAIFHGHEHSHDDLIHHMGVPMIFDSHIGGSWGTDYNGFRVVEVWKNNDVVTYMMNPSEALGKNSI